VKRGAAPGAALGAWKVLICGRSETRRAHHHPCGHAVWL